MKVIDAHAHLLHGYTGLDSIAESGVFNEIWIMDLSGTGTLEEYSFATQEEILEAMRRYPGFIRAFGFLDLDRAAPDDIRRLKDLGFMGLKPYKQLKPYGDPAYYPLYQTAQELRMPILFHTGLIAHADPFNGRVTRSFGSENMRPSSLASIAEAFPDLRIIAGHIGWPWLDETEQNLYFYRNISNDISGYRNCFDRLPHMMDRRAHDGTPRFFNEKMHFATDEFYGTPETNAHALKILTFWKLYFELVGSVYYRWGAPEEQTKFFHDNAMKIRLFDGF